MHSFKILFREHLKIEHLLEERLKYNYQNLGQGMYSSVYVKRAMTFSRDFSDMDKLLGLRNHSPFGVRSTASAIDSSTLQDDSFQSYDC